jgi:hypothetical protein
MQAHERLIAFLAADLKPVKRLAAPTLRAAAWLMVVGAAAIVMAMTADLAALQQKMMAATDMWLAVMGSTLTAVFAAIAAFQLSLPDRRTAWVFLPLPPTLLWIGASGAGCLRSWLIPGTHDASLYEARDCLTFILSMSVPLSALLLLMLRRANPLRFNFVAVTGGLAAAAAAATLLNFVHPYDAAATDLAVHAVAVALVILANRAIAGRVLAVPSEPSEQS